MDMHETVTQLRTDLAEPLNFRDWLLQQGDFVFGPRAAKRADDGTYQPGIDAMEGTPLAYYMRYLRIADRTLSDTTHAYWWVGVQCYSLMLPAWARGLQRQFSLEWTLTGAAVLEKLDSVVGVPA